MDFASALFCSWLSWCLFFDKDKEECSHAFNHPDSPLKSLVNDFWDTVRPFLKFCFFALMTLFFKIF